MTDDWTRDFYYNMGFKAATKGAKQGTPWLYYNPPSTVANEAPTHTATPAYTDLLSYSPSAVSVYLADYGATVSLPRTSCCCKCGGCR